VPYRTVRYIRTHVLFTIAWFPCDYNYVRLYHRLSGTTGIVSKGPNASSKFFHFQSTILVFRELIAVTKFRRGHPNGSDKCRSDIKYRDFRSAVACISETVRDRGIVTTVDYSEIVSNHLTLSDF